MQNNLLFKQPIFQWGLVLLIGSSLLFVLPSLLPAIQNSENLGIFMFHYALTVIYFFIVLFSGRLKRDRNGLPLVIINLLLFFISAFALNREMNIFHDSVGWLQVLLLVSCINLLVMSWQMELPRSIIWMQTFLLALSICVFTYYALYLLPVYPYGFLGTVALGIGLHTFVPLVLGVYALRMLRRQLANAKAFRFAAAAGFLLVLLTTIGYSYQWYAAKTNMEKAYNRALVPDQTAWPAWVELMQQVPLNSMSNRVIKSDLVYTVSNWDIDIFNMPSLNWSEPKKHDPLVVVASFFSGNLNIPREERIQLLQARNDNSYATEQRLWTGNNLETVHLNTEVQIWPAMHLAYTEKTITVANRSAATRWRGRQQEAIYVFQLPEGGVVTSLSLWIDGREMKSVLTTKGKAAKAYNTIVGVEVRDPSVVHWQEGNRVSVRVFPVVAEDSRTFKIGITAPMPEADGKIHYEQVQFQGPDPQHATERIRIHLMETTGVKPITVALKKHTEAQYVYDGNYRPDLSLSLPANDVLPASFVKEGAGFEIAAYEAVTEQQHFTTLYADINASWDIKQWETLRTLSAKRVLKVYDQGWLKVTPDNAAEVFERLRKRPTTLFPFYGVKNAAEALIVTQSGANTPSLSQIKNSSGFDALLQSAANGQRYYVFHIGEKPSLYLSSLRELRLFRYDQGSIEKLSRYLKNNRYAAESENSDRVVYYNAGLQITRKENMGSSTAPDHLLRLFAYNHILQQGGLSLLTGDTTVETRWSDLASYAHIVSPVSSMIVLEQQQDYERFDIDAAEKGLQNASIQNNGAVPEPHEWALIIICLVLLAYYRFSNQLKTQKLWSNK